jgi:hypothetical protein
MPASYPTSIKSWAVDHISGDVVEAAHPNVLEAEVNAIEATIGVQPAQSTSRALGQAYSAYDNAGTLFSTIAARLSNLEIGIVADTHTQYLKTTGGTVTGDIAMGTNKVTGLGAPTVGTDAATKTYVDAGIAAVSGGGTISVADTFVSVMLLGGM